MVKRIFAGVLAALCMSGAYAANVAPTISIAPDPQSSLVAPGSLFLSANANDSDGYVTKVAYYNGTTLVSTVTGPPYGFIWYDVPVGSYTFTAKATDNRGAVTTSAPVTVTIVANLPPTVSLTAPAVSGNYVAPATVSLAAIASDPDGHVGSVAYYRDGILIGSSSTAPSFPLNWHNAPAGTYSVTARATDYKGAVTISSPVALVVKPNILPTVLITSPVNNAVFGYPAMIQFSANAQDADGTIARVDFFRNGTSIGTAWVAPFTISWGAAGIGSHRITAKTTDDKGGVATSAPVNFTVIANVGPTVSMTGPAANSTFVATANITLTAAAADSDGTVANVGFYRDGVLLGTSTAAPFKYNWVTSAVGTYSLTARATDDKGAVTISAPVNMTVKANVAPAVSLTAPAANASYLAPATIMLAANATDTDGTIVKVDFYSGAVLIGSDTTSPYILDWPNVATGAYSITAKATDDKGAVKTSTALPATVIAVPIPTISISGPTNNANFIAPASFTLTANAAITGDTISKVEYISGANVVGTAVAAPYSVSLANIGAGTYTVSAKASGTLGGTAMSAPISLVVNANVAPVVTLDATPANATAPAVITLNATALDGDGSVTKVEFFNGTALLATFTQAPYSFVWNDVTADSYQLTAKATDNAGAQSISMARTVTVAAPGVVAQVFYIYSDQINTAREITNEAGLQVWRADPDPFGANLPDENPAGQGVFTYNQRFPGQYFDRETGLHYNYYRDYDPQTGRYVQSDPIGLDGGINTYAYVENDPLSYIDPEGLSKGPVRGGTVINVGPGRNAQGQQGSYTAGRFYPAVGPSISPYPYTYNRSSNTQCSPCMEIFFVASTAGGTTRPQHRRGGNDQLYDHLTSLGSGNIGNFSAPAVRNHMNGGSGGLRNPPGLIWHHPVGRPQEIWLIRRCDHQNPAFRDWLHPLPNGGGGMLQNFGQGF